MARPATARWSADGRPIRQDRPPHRDLPADPGPPAPTGRRPALDHPAVPATPANPIDPGSLPDATPGALHPLRPPGHRERLGPRLARQARPADRAHRP